jgi:hypothetical protein
VYPYRPFCGNKRRREALPSRVEASFGIDAVGAGGEELCGGSVMIIDCAEARRELVKKPGDG